MTFILYLGAFAVGFSIGYVIGYGIGTLIGKYYVSKFI